MRVTERSFPVALLVTKVVNERNEKYTSLSMSTTLGLREESSTEIHLHSDWLTRMACFSYCTRQQ